MAQQVIGRNVALKLERVEELLWMLLPPHHRAASRIDRCATIESCRQRPFNELFFNSIQDLCTTRPREIPVWKAALGGRLLPAFARRKTSLNGRAGVDLQS